MSKTVALCLLVGALALPSAAFGASAVAKGSGVLQPGCPLNPLATDVFCPTQPIWFSLDAKKSPLTTKGRFMSRWLVAGKARSLFAGGVRCMNMVGNAVVVGGLLTNPRALLGTPFVEYAVDNGTSGDLVSDLGIFPFEDPDLVFLPVDFPSTCPTPGLLGSIYGYQPLDSGTLVVRPGTP